MKRIILTLAILPTICFASAKGSDLVRNSPLHPWYSNGGTDLIVNFSKLNFDTRLLDEVRKHPEVGYPFFNLSGKIDSITSAKCLVVAQKNIHMEGDAL